MKMTSIELDVHERISLTLMIALIRLGRKERRKRTNFNTHRKLSLITYRISSTRNNDRCSNEDRERENIGILFLSLSLFRLTVIVINDVVCRSVSSSTFLSANITNNTSLTLIFSSLVTSFLFSFVHYSSIINMHKHHLPELIYRWDVFVIFLCQSSPNLGISFCIFPFLLSLSLSFVFERFEEQRRISRSMNYSSKNETKRFAACEETFLFLFVSSTFNDKEELLSFIFSFGYSW